MALRDKYLAAMDDDFNTGLATSVLFDLLRTANRHIDQHKLSAASDANSPAVASLKVVASVLRELTAVLGLFRKPISGATGGEEAQKMLDDVMSLVIELRKDARARKDFATGDQIRDRLSQLGIALLDTKEGTSWEKK